MMHMHHDSISPPCVCTALRKASRAVSRVYDDALSSHGFSTAQFAILRHIARGEPVALSRLAEALVMDRTSLYRAIAPLEGRGWVLVTAGPARSRLAALTDEGRTVMEAAVGDWQAMQMRMTDALGVEQWAALQGALRNVVGFAEQGVR